MAVEVVFGLGQPDRDPITGHFDMAGMGLEHGDLVVVFAWAIGNEILGNSSTDYFGLVASFLGGAQAQVSGSPSDPAWLYDGYPVISSADDAAIHWTACLYSSTGSSTLAPGWTVAPVSIEDTLVNVVVVRGANSAKGALTAGYESPAAFDLGHEIPYVGVFGAPSGVPDGLWVTALYQYIVIRSYSGGFPSDGSETSYLPYNPLDLSGPHPEPDTGSVVPPPSALFNGPDMPIADLGVAEFLPTGNWFLDNDSAGTGDDLVEWFMSGATFSVQCYQDDDYDPEYPPPVEGQDPEVFEFTNRWTLMGPLLHTSPGQACDLLERHDQELEEHFRLHGCGDFLYTYRWPTFYLDLLAGNQRAVEVMEARDKELEEASRHQGEGSGQVNDGSCVITLTHRWPQFFDYFKAGDARAWDILEQRDREIEAGRSACACVTEGGGGG